MNILKIGNKKKKKNDVTTKLKLGGPLSPQNTKKAAQITAMKDAGMATERDIQWLTNYNKSKKK